MPYAGAVRATAARAKAVSNVSAEVSMASLLTRNTGAKCDTRPNVLQHICEDACMRHEPTC